VARWDRSRDRFGFSPASTDRESQALALRIKRTADFCGDFNLPLHAAPGNQRGVQLGEDIRERQSDQKPIAIILGRKDVRGYLAQFSEGNLDSSA
jgi:hypothetical protein